MRNALIVVDMQNDFVSGILGTPQARDIVGNIRRRIEETLREGGGVIFTQDTHEREGCSEVPPSAEATAIPPHCVKDTEGWQIVEELRPYAGIKFQKQTFMALGIAGHIADHLENSPDCKIELCGVCTDICVLSNALYLRAKYPCVEIVVDPACCAGTTPENHAAALQAMKSNLITVL